MGKNCKICPAVRLGPYVSVGDNCVLKRCDVSESIIMENCRNRCQDGLCAHSIIAKGSEIVYSDVPKKHQFLLGERSQVNL